MANSLFHSLLKPNNDRLNALKNATTKNKYVDPNAHLYWKLTPDKAGNASAIIRFLPAPPPEQMFYLQYYNHNFRGPNGYYIENSLRTLSPSTPDPVAEYLSRLWTAIESGRTDLKPRANDMRRSLRFEANILVVNDPANKDNNGKVFLFRFGKKLFEKIQECTNPKYAEDTEFDPFHPITGANFRLRQKLQGKTDKHRGYPSYDDSKFDEPSPLFGGDEEQIVKVLEKLIPLPEMKFKTYGELKEKLDRVMGFDTAVYLEAPEPTRVSDEPYEGLSPSSHKTGFSEKTPMPSRGSAVPWMPPPMSDSAVDDTDDDDIDSRLSSAFDDE